MTRLLTATALCSTLALLPACHHMGGYHHGQHGKAMHDVTQAICILSATQGNTVTGWVSFTQTDDGVRVQAQVDGLTPGKHGFHVHQFGDLSAANGTATGGHFNPDGDDHSLPGDHEELMLVGGHAGDLGNLEADANGHATYDVTYHNLTLQGGLTIVGRAIIIHADEDDGGQPTGNAGPRIAQGVIGIDSAE